MPKTKHPAKPATLYELFEQAIANLPFPNLEHTSITQGDIEVDDNDQDVEYSEEYIFTAGKLLDEPLKAGGWVDLRRDDGEVYISAFFGVARNGDWKNEEAQVLPEHHAIQGQYDLESQSWEFWIDAY